MVSEQKKSKFYNYWRHDKINGIKNGGKMGLNEFQASNGWLVKFQKRHGIVSKTISGESGLVDESKIENFKELLFNKLSEYEAENIFNCDEAGLFFKCTNSKTLAFSAEDVVSGKFSKERITVHFCSMTGEKYEPLVIGRSKTPRAFKNINLKELGIMYKSNKKSWMTLEIFNVWINDLNTKMKLESRKILLILDNAPVHPCDSEYSNIELLYLPPNCTSKIQPLDQGIIKSFKDQYKRLINQHVLMEIEFENTDYQEIVKNIDMKNCVTFVSVAWKNVKVECIVNCFKKALENSKICEFSAGIETEFYLNTSTEFSICQQNTCKDDDDFIDKLDYLPEESGDEEQCEKSLLLACDSAPGNADAYKAAKLLEN